MSLCSTKHSNGYFIQSKKPKSLSVLKTLREKRFHELSAPVTQPLPHLACLPCLKVLGKGLCQDLDTELFPLPRTLITHLVCLVCSLILYVSVQMSIY